MSALMGEAKKHHYVPAFYLAAWTGDDGRISIFQNFGGRIHRSRHTPKHTGFEYHLYSYSQAFSAKDRADIETTFFQRLDDVGALIVRKIIGYEEISDEERILWTQFVLSMRVRTPDNVAKIKAAGSEYLVRNLDAGQSDYEKARSSDDPERFVDWVELKYPGLIENIGVGQIPKISSSPRVMSNFAAFDWYVVDIEKSSKALLSSDRPCVFTSGLDKPDCIVALPLSPRHAFFAFRSGSKAQERLMAASVNELVRSLNDSVVAQARERVYAKSSEDAPDSFLIKRLSRTEPRQRA